MIDQSTAILLVNEVNMNVFNNVFLSIRILLFLSISASVMTTHSFANNLECLSVYSHRLNIIELSRSYLASMGGNERIAHEQFKAMIDRLKKESKYKLYPNFLKTTDTAHSNEKVMSDINRHADSFNTNIEKLKQLIESNEKILNNDTDKLSRKDIRVFRGIDGLFSILKNDLAFLENNGHYLRNEIGSIEVEIDNIESYANIQDRYKDNLAVFVSEIYLQKKQFPNADHTFEIIQPLLTQESSHADIQSTLLAVQKDKLEKRRSEIRDVLNTIDSQRDLGLPSLFITTGITPTLAQQKINQYQSRKADFQRKEYEKEQKRHQKELAKSNARKRRQEFIRKVKKSLAIEILMGALALSGAIGNEIHTDLVTLNDFNNQAYASSEQSPANVNSFVRSIFKNHSNTISLISSALLTDNILKSLNNETIIFIIKSLPYSGSNQDYKQDYHFFNSIFLNSIPDRAYTDAEVAEMTAMFEKRKVTGIELEDDNSFMQVHENTLKLLNQHIYRSGIKSKIGDVSKGDSIFLPPDLLKMYIIINSHNTIETLFSGSTNPVALDTSIKSRYAIIKNADQSDGPLKNKLSADELLETLIRVSRLDLDQSSIVVQNDELNKRLRDFAASTGRNNLSFGYSSMGLQFSVLDFMLKQYIYQMEKFPEVKSSFSTSQIDLLKQLANKMYSDYGIDKNTFIRIYLDNQIQTIINGSNIISK